MQANRAVYVHADSVMRLEAYATGNLLANCEDCGCPIPVELTKCSSCVDMPEMANPAECDVCGEPVSLPDELCDGVQGW